MSNQKLIPAVIVGLLVAVIGYYVLNAPDNRDPGQKIGDAMRQLQDRTPGEKLQDAVKDEKRDLKKSLDQK